MRQKGASLYGNALVAHNQLAHGQAHVGGLQGHAHVLNRDAKTGHALGINLHQHGAIRATDGLHILRAFDALDVNLHAVRHALQVVGTAVLVLAEQCQRDDGHIVHALGLDQGLHDTQPFGQPVGVVSEGVVQTHQGLGSWHTDLELNRQDGHAGARNRHDVFHARDLRQHLLGRNGHHLLHIAHGSTWKRHQHIGHGHIDLRLFLTGRHHHGKNTQQQCHQGQQWRDLCALKQGRNAPRNAQGF